MQINKILETYAYSDDGAQILANVIGAASSLVTADDGSFMSMAILGSTLGFIFMVIKAIETQRMDFNFLVYGVIAYVVLFGTTIKMEIKTSGSGLGVAILENVPLGIALPAHIISIVTHNAQIKTSEHYSNISNAPSVVGETGQIINKLGTLLRYRDLVTNPEALSTDTGAYGKGSAAKTLSRYIGNCIIPDPLKDIKKIEQSENPLPLLASDWGSIETMVYLPGDSAGHMKNCIDAGTLIIDYFETNKDTLATILIDASKKSGRAKQEFSYRTTEYIDDLFSGFIDSKELLLNIYLYEVIQFSQEAYHSELNPALAKMFTDAREKRLMKAIVDERLFQNVIWKSASYIQAFVFALFPFFVITIMMGSAGLKIIMSYVMVLTWVALWGMGSVVVEFITDSGMRQAMHDYLTAQLPLNSDYSSEFILSPAGTVKLYAEISRWYIIGSEMMTAVPIIMMALVTGSMFSLSSVANKLSTSQNEVDTKEAAPTDGKFGYGGKNIFHGFGANGDYNGIKNDGSNDSNTNANRSFNINEQNSNTLTDTATTAESAAISASTQTQDAFSKVFEHLHGSTEGSQVTEEKSATQTKQAEKANSLLKNISNQHQFGETEKKSLRLLASLGLASPKAIKNLKKADNIHKNEQDPAKRQTALTNLTKGMKLPKNVLSAMNLVSKGGMKALGGLIHSASAKAGVDISKTDALDKTESVINTLASSKMYTEKNASTLQDSLKYATSTIASDSDLEKKTASSIDAYTKSRALNKTAAKTQQAAEVGSSASSGNLSLTAANISDYVQSHGNRENLSDFANKYVTDDKEKETLLANPRTKDSQNILNKALNKAKPIDAFLLAEKIGLTNTKTEQPKDYVDQMEKSGDFTNTMDNAKGNGDFKDKGIHDEGENLQHTNKKFNQQVLKNVANGKRKLNPEENKALIQSQHLTNEQRGLMSELNIPKHVQAQFAAENATSVAANEAAHDDKTSLGAVGNFLLNQLEGQGSEIGGQAILSTSPNSSMTKMFDSGREKMASLMSNFSGNNLQTAFNKLGLGDSSAVQKLQKDEELGVNDLQEASAQIAQLTNMNDGEFTQKSGLSNEERDSKNPNKKAAFNQVSQGVNKEALEQAFMNLVSPNGAGYIAGNTAGEIVTAGVTIGEGVLNTAESVGQSVMNMVIELNNAAANLLIGDTEGAQAAWDNYNTQASAFNEETGVNSVIEIVKEFALGIEEGLKDVAMEESKKETPPEKVNDSVAPQNQDPNVPN